MGEWERIEKIVTAYGHEQSYLPTYQYVGRLQPLMTPLLKPCGNSFTCESNPRMENLKLEIWLDRLLAKMDYAMKSLGFLSPQYLSRCVSVGSTSMTPKQWTMPAPHARPYRVSNWDRTLRKGIMAESLRDLLEKAHLALPVVGTITLVLDEDGTTVETEEFFQTLQEGTVLLVLTKGQSWYPAKTAGYQLALSHEPHHRHDVARVTFDFYKTNPEDFIGCLNFKATLYGAYSISYDMHCYGAKRLMKEALRWTLITMQATGHILIGSSCYVQQLLDATEEEKRGSEREDSPSTLSKLCPFPARKMLQ